MHWYTTLQAIGHPVRAHPPTHLGSRRYSSVSVLSFSTARQRVCSCMVSSRLDAYFSISPNRWSAMLPCLLLCSVCAHLSEWEKCMTRGQNLEHIKHVVYCSKLTRRFGLPQLYRTKHFEQYTMCSILSRIGPLVIS